MSDSQDSVQQAHRLGGSAERITEYYANWASAYDQDLEKEQYKSPGIIAELLADTAADRSRPHLTEAAVLDAGCGTGLVGKALADRGVTRIDGFDLSDSMVEEARRTGVYRSLSGGVDMNLGLPDCPDDGYDASVCCGVFTLGHVPPQALRGLLRVTGPGGLVVLSTRKRYVSESGFDRYVRELADEGALKTVRHLEDAEYTVDEPGDYWAFEVLR